MTSMTDSSKLKCDACGKDIDGGYYSSLGKERKNYHPNCKPQLFYIFDKDIPVHPQENGNVRKTIP